MTEQFVGKVRKSTPGGRGAGKEVNGDTVFEFYGSPIVDDKISIGCERLSVTSGYEHMQGLPNPP